MRKHALSWRQQARIVLALGWSDFVLKYRGSVLGYLWSFLAPLAQFIVILHVFRPFFSVDVRMYPLYLFLGIILWEFFSVTTSACMAMLFEKAAIIQKVSVPRPLLILAVGWTNLLVLLTRLSIFAVAAVAYRVQADASMLYLPLLLLQLLMLTLGVGMLLSSFSLRYRDIPHLWGILLQALFWLTPIAYSARLAGPVLAGLARVPGQLWPPDLGSLLDFFIQFQPLSIFFSAARRSLLPFAAGVPPSVSHMAGLTLLCAAIFVAGYAVFRYRSRYFIQEF